jgi:hypothetical protein
MHNPIRMNKPRRVLAAIAASVLGLGIAITGATAAQAHTPKASLTCSLATVDLTSYDSAATAEVTLDGKPIHTGTFDGSYTLKQPLTATANHSLVVTVDSAAGNGTEFDFTFNEKVDTCAPVTPVEHAEVGIYVYPLLDSTKPAGWTNSGQQIFCDSKTGTDWYTALPCTLPDEVCGPDWGYQQDKVKWTEPATFSWPATVTYDPTAPNGGDTIGWPPIYAAAHGELSDLTTVPSCDLPTKPLATPDPVTQNDVCGPQGSYTIPASTGVVWSIGGKTVQPGTYQVTGDSAFTVVAAPQLPDYGFAFDEQTEWPLSFTAAADVCGQQPPTAEDPPADDQLNTLPFDDLETLALANTGAGAPEQALGNAGLLLLVLGLGATLIAQLARAKRATAL